MKKFSCLLLRIPQVSDCLIFHLTGGLESGCLSPVTQSWPLRIELPNSVFREGQVRARRLRKFIQMLAGSRASVLQEPCKTDNLLG